MNRHFFISLLCLFLGVHAVSATPFADANRRFDSRDFAGAATVYEGILSKDGPRASVYYNLGNARQSLKQYGPAILAYERARLLTPRDPDLLANLALARKAMAAFENGSRNPRLEAALRYFSRNEWSWMVAGSALFLGIIAMVCGSVKLSRSYRRGAWISSAVAGVAILVGVTVLYLRRDESNQGIVLVEDATVRLSPFGKAESLGTPGPGSAVHLGEASGDFIYVEVPGTSLKGWLPLKDVAPVVVDHAGKSIF